MGGAEGGLRYSLFFEKERGLDVLGRLMVVGMVAVERGPVALVISVVVVDPVELAVLCDCAGVGTLSLEGRGNVSVGVNGYVVTWISRSEARERVVGVTGKSG